MNKNYSLALIVGLLCLTIGVLYGRYSNENGRYTFMNYTDSFMIFDTSTGIFYIRKNGGIYKRNTVNDYEIQQKKKEQSKKSK